MRRHSTTGVPRRAGSTHTIGRAAYVWPVLLSLAGLARPANPKAMVADRSRGRVSCFPHCPAPRAMVWVFVPRCPIRCRSSAAPRDSGCGAEHSLMVTSSYACRDYRELVARDLAGKADPGALAPYAPRRGPMRAATNTSIHETISCRASRRATQISRRSRIEHVKLGGLDGDASSAGSIWAG